MPVIQSLLDTDFYHFTMGQQEWKRYSDIPVTYGLTNRTKDIRLAEVIREDRLREDLDCLRELRFKPNELAYLGALKNGDKPLFSSAFIGYLKNFRLPPYTLDQHQGQFILQFEGEGAQYWETPGLRTVNALYTEAWLAGRGDELREEAYQTGRMRLMEKILELLHNPKVIFFDFGTRRAFNPQWHEYVIVMLTTNLSASQCAGTSNVYFAMKYGLNPVGTIAHRMFMVMEAAMRDSGPHHVQRSHERVMDDWWDEYGYELSTALPDTFSSSWHLDHVFPKYARAWRGVRQDSGDPFTFGEELITCYQSLGIDPRSKYCVFSNGLDIDTMKKLYDIFHDRINVRFGWGTNLTNDLDIPQISIVVKPIRANGVGTVKLSDNLAKAQGQPEDIAMIKKEIGYQNGTYAECTY